MSEPTVLLADNKEDYRKSLRQLLEEEGYLVTEVGSVQEAEEGLKAVSVDLALVDLRLTNDEDDHDMSGLKVAEWAGERGIPCIVITAYNSVETTRLALRSRGAEPLAVDYIPKKDSPQAILNAIRRLRGLTILHVSDLHLQAIDHGEVPFDQEQAREKFLDDVTKQPGVGFNPIQVIIISGDISFQCQEESFNRTRHFLTELIQQLGISKEQVVLVPGNHDINRIKAQATQDSLLAMEIRDATWFSKFDDYLEFTTHFYGEPAFTKDKLYRIFTFDKSLAVVAFNSCLVEGDTSRMCPVCMEKKQKEHYYGWINREQVKLAGEELDKQNWGGLRIAAFHHHVGAEEWHPLKDQCQGDHLWNYHHKDHRLKFTFFEQGFRILLHGHRHKGELRQSSAVGANVPYHFGSGAFWIADDNQQETASYLLLELTPLLGKSRVIMRRYYPATNEMPGGWGPDGFVRRDGIVPLPDIAISELEPEL
jgi:CheY-like chemotaxis protein